MLKKLVCRISLMLLFLIPAAPLALASPSTVLTSGGIVASPQDVTGGDPEPPPPEFVQVLLTILSVG